MAHDDYVMCVWPRTHLYIIDFQEELTATRVRLVRLNKYLNTVLSSYATYWRPCAVNTFKMGSPKQKKSTENAARKLLRYSTNLNVPKRELVLFTQTELEKN